MSNRFVHTAVFFFVTGVALGLYMGAAQDFRFVHVHAHLNLLGWVGLALAGLLYRVHPELQRGWLPHTHYWLYTVGLLVFMGGFAWRSLGSASATPLVAGGAMAVGAGVLLFAFNVFARLRSAARDTEAGSATHR